MLPAGSFTRRSGFWSPVTYPAVPATTYPRRPRSYRFVTAFIDRVLSLFARRYYRVPPLPPYGPLLVAPNHVSWTDPLYLAAALTRAGRTPRFVIMESVLRAPVVGAILRYFDHIGLDRGRPADPALLEPVRAALRRGECVVLYPEGGVTQREDYLPGRPLPGLGVLAAELEVPVLPVAQWGAQYVVGRGALAWRAFPPRRAGVVVEALPIVMPPAAAGVLAARRFTGAVLDSVTERVMELRSGYDSTRS